ncbi:MAG TPA: hypothetical protein VGZ32_22665 [Actinocrinis sp.]|uniref:hypothetical protein n=1 Tax=Actinocrinis sp. TaxID=1920516 RepID=UPI002DDD204D|nr:hypothetical protein [Actinocrinis sp.]HEV3173168.1 hypothetical protein [Actinocrinis sp.]
MSVRPTLRCLTQDLGLPLPSARVLLDDVEHPLLQKSAEQFADADTPHERIRAIDDAVLFKAKVGRWRGAIFVGDEHDIVHAWLVAAGTREDGSPEDFYATLREQCRAAPRVSDTTPNTNAR